VIAVGAPAYTPRLVDRLLKELMTQLPALLITGPRATGKTTSLRRYAATVVRLDRPAEAAAFRADPDAALRSLPEPILLDEWQAVPDVLGAVKRTVDNDPRPGRFLLTGSVRADLDEQTWPGTGRLVRLPMYGLTVREERGGVTGDGFLDRLAGGRLDRFGSPAQPPDLRDYVELALRGGYPEAALRLTGNARQLWLDSYLDQLITRDAASLDGGRDPVRLRRCFEVLALNTAGLATDKTIYEAAGIDRRTFLAYERLLQNLLVLELLPAWTTNRLSRLVRRPKRYLVDPSLFAAALRLDVNGVLRDAGALGRVIDTFVAAQLRPEAALAQSRPRLYHLRQEDGRRELDMVTEFGGQSVVAIEVKASAAPTGQDGRHLVWLRDQLGERFLAGVVLHTGPRVYSIADRVFALPIACIWDDHV
jgi:predicted AAA+ superfamily ATPase